MAQPFDLVARIQANVTNLPEIQRVLGKLTNQQITFEVAGKNNFRNAEREMANLEKKVKRVRGGIEELGNVVGTAARRFGGISVATGTFLGLARGIKNSVGEAITFEREMVKVAQATDNAIASTESLRKNIMKVADEYASSGVELAKYSRILAQAGFTTKQTNAAIKLLAKADLTGTFGGISENVEGMIAIMQQFGKEAAKSGREIEFLEKAYDSISRVSKKYAIESGDIIEAVKKAGGVFATAGGSLEEFIAILTSVRATTRESADVIANGLKTIATRLQDKNNIKTLQQLGIQLEDARGNFVGVFEAVQRLSIGLKDLDPKSIRFANIVKELGGIYQIGRFITLIREAKLSQEALNDAQNASGDVNRDVAKQQKTLGFQIDQLRQKFNNLVLEFTKTSTFKEFSDFFIGLGDALLSVGDAIRRNLPLFKTFITLIASRAAYFAFQSWAGLSKPLTRTVSMGDTTSKAAFPSMVPLQTGGHVTAKKSGQKSDRDSLGAILQPGEYVLRKQAVNNLGVNTLNMMNQGLLKTVDIASRRKAMFTNKASGPIAYSGTVAQVLKKTNLKSLESLYDITNPEDTFYAPFINKLPLRNASGEKVRLQDVKNQATKLMNDTLRAYSSGGPNAANSFISSTLGGFTDKVTKKTFSDTNNVFKFLTSIQGAIAERIFQSANPTFQKLPNAYGMDMVSTDGKFAEIKATSTRMSPYTMIGKALIAIAKLNNPKTGFKNKKKDTIGIPETTFFDTALRFNTGGTVPGSGRGDKIPALLEPGEVVVNRRAAKSVGYDVLHAMNRGSISMLAGGGTAGAGHRDNSLNRYREEQETFTAEKLIASAKGGDERAVQELLVRIARVTGNFKEVGKVFEELVGKVKISNSVLSNLGKMSSSKLGNIQGRPKTGYGEKGMSNYVRQDIFDKSPSKKYTLDDLQPSRFGGIPKGEVTRIGETEAARLAGGAIRDTVQAQAQVENVKATANVAKEVKDSGDKTVEAVKEVVETSKTVAEEIKTLPKKEGGSGTGKKASKPQSLIDAAKAVKEIDKRENEREKEEERKYGSGSAAKTSSNLPPEIAAEKAKLEEELKGIADKRTKPAKAIKNRLDEISAMEGQELPKKPSASPKDAKPDVRDPNSSIAKKYANAAANSDAIDALEKEQDDIYKKANKRKNRELNSKEITRLKEIDQEIENLSKETSAPVLNASQSRQEAMNEVEAEQAQRLASQPEVTPVKTGSATPLYTDKTADAKAQAKVETQSTQNSTKQTKPKSKTGGSGGGGKKPPKPPVATGGMPPEDEEAKRAEAIRQGAIDNEIEAAKKNNQSPVVPPPLTLMEKLAKSSAPIRKPEKIPSNPKSEQTYVSALDRELARVLNPEYSFSRGTGNVIQSQAEADSILENVLKNIPDQVKSKMGNVNAKVESETQRKTYLDPLIAKTEQLVNVQKGVVSQQKAGSKEQLQAMDELKILENRLTTLKKASGSKGFFKKGSKGSTISLKSKAATESTLMHEVGHSVDYAMGSGGVSASSQKGTFQNTIAEKLKPSLEAYLVSQGKSTEEIKYRLRNEEIIADLFANGTPAVRDWLSATTDAAVGMEGLAKIVEEAEKMGSGVVAGLGGLTSKELRGEAPITPTYNPTAAKNKVLEKAELAKKEQEFISPTPYVYSSPKAQNIASRTQANFTQGLYAPGTAISQQGTIALASRAMTPEEKAQSEARTSKDRKTIAKENVNNTKAAKAKELLASGMSKQDVSKWFGSQEGKDFIRKSQVDAKQAAKLTSLQGTASRSTLTTQQASEMGIKLAGNAGGGGGGGNPPGGSVASSSGGGDSPDNRKKDANIVNKLTSLENGITPLILTLGLLAASTDEYASSIGNMIGLTKEQSRSLQESITGATAFYLTMQQLNQLVKQVGGNNTVDKEGNIIDIDGKATGKKSRMPSGMRKFLGKTGGVTGILSMAAIGGSIGSGIGSYNQSQANQQADKKEKKINDELSLLAVGGNADLSSLQKRSREAASLKERGAKGATYGGYGGAVGGAIAGAASAAMFASPTVVGIPIAGAIGAVAGGVAGGFGGVAAANTIQQSTSETRSIDASVQAQYTAAKSSYEFSKSLDSVRNGSLKTTDQNLVLSDTTKRLSKAMDTVKSNVRSTANELINAEGNNANFATNLGGFGSKDITAFKERASKATEAQALVKEQAKELKTQVSNSISQTLAEKISTATTGGELQNIVSIVDGKFQNADSEIESLLQQIQEATRLASDNPDDAKAYQEGVKAREDEEKRIVLTVQARALEASRIEAAINVRNAELAIIQKVNEALKITAESSFKLQESQQAMSVITGQSLGGYQSGRVQDLSNIGTDKQAFTSTMNSLAALLPQQGAGLAQVATTAASASAGFKDASVQSGVLNGLNVLQKTIKPGVNVDQSKLGIRAELEKAVPDFKNLDQGIQTKVIEDLYGTLTEGKLDLTQINDIAKTISDSGQMFADALVSAGEAANNYLSQMQSINQSLISENSKLTQLKSGLIDIDARGMERMASVTTMGEADKNRLAANREAFRVAKDQQELVGAGLNIAPGTANYGSSLQNINAQIQANGAQLASGKDTRGNDLSLAQRDLLGSNTMKLENQAQSLTGVLTRLTDQSDKASDKMEEISRLQAQKEFVKNRVESYAFGTTEEKMAMSETYGGLQQVMATGNFQAIPDELKGSVRDLMKQVSELNPDGQVAKMYQGIQIGAIKEQQAMGFLDKKGAEEAIAAVKGEDLQKEKKLKAELNQIYQDELTAQRALIDAQVQLTKTYQDFADKLRADFVGNQPGAAPVVPQPGVAVQAANTVAVKEATPQQPQKEAEKPYKYKPLVSSAPTKKSEAMPVNTSELSSGTNVSTFIPDPNIIKQSFRRDTGDPIDSLEKAKSYAESFKASLGDNSSLVNNIGMDETVSKKEWRGEFRPDTNSIGINTKANPRSFTVDHEMGHATDLALGKQYGSKDYISNEKGTFQNYIAEQMKPQLEAGLKSKGISGDYLKYRTSNNEIFADLMANTTPEARKILTSTTDKASGMEALRNYEAKLGTNIPGFAGIPISQQQNAQIAPNMPAPDMSFGPMIQGMKEFTDKLGQISEQFSNISMTHTLNVDGQLNIAGVDISSISNQIRDVLGEYIGQAIQAEFSKRASTFRTA